MTRATAGRSGRRRYLRVAAALVALLVASVVPISPASAGPFAGTCLVTLDANYSPAAAQVPAPWGEVQLSDAGGNFCATNAGFVALRMSGILFTAPTVGRWGCFGGVVNGGVKVILDIVGFSNPTTTATVVNAGGTLHMVATADLVRFEAEATFAQGAAELATCAAGGTVASTTWTGGMTFVDPTV